MSARSPWWPHERVVVRHDPASGLRAIVAVHSTVLGPGLGGLRMRPYANMDAALDDVLRLSAAMTLKASAAGLDLGGGKAVILDDGDLAGRAARLRAFGDLVASLGGGYITAEDIGTTTADLDVIATRTPYAVGLSPEHGGGGDPSPSTAATVLGAIRHAARARLEAPDLNGVMVGVLGLGKVGLDLAHRLKREGARLVLADINSQHAARVADELDAQVVDHEQLPTLELDVLAPCALGGLVTDELVPELRTAVIAGAANNVLADDELAERLAARDILFVPDFLANSGGLIHCSDELSVFDPDRVAQRVAAAVERVGRVLDDAVESGRTPLLVATQDARARLDAATAAVA